MAAPMRPRRSDGEATRARILQSAGQLFAERGYAETTGKAIAAHAGVNLASINYHFGDRAGLYQAVLVEAHRHFVRLEVLEEIAKQDVPASEKLRNLIAMILTHFGDTEHWCSRILMRELASPSSHFGVLRKDEVPPKLNVVLSIISDVSGIPIEDPVLFCCLLSIAAPCAMLLLSGAAMVADDRVQLPVEALIDHLHRFALGGLDAVARQRRLVEAGESS